MEKKQEIDCIKISLIDELQEISTIIGKMLETYNTTKIIPASYFNDLSEHRESFDLHKPRLFLIGNTELRKEMCDFYKKLTINIKKSRDKVGTLKPDGDNQESITSSITTDFTESKTKSDHLKTALEKYRFKPFYIV